MYYSKIYGKIVPRLELYSGKRSSPALVMNLLKLFFSFTSVSVAFASNVSGSLATEFSEIREQNGTDLADASPETTGNQLLSWREYEKLLINKDFAGISEAFKRNSFDFSYIPRTKDFFRVFLDRRCIEGDEIMKNYFESGVIDEMVEFLFTSYQDIIESAMNNKKFFTANLALDRLIAKHRPEINSPNFKSKSSSDPIRQAIIVEKCYNPRFDPIRTGFEPLSNRVRLYDIECNFDCNNLDPKEMEKFNFYKKYFYIFKNTPQREEWSVYLSRRTIFLKFFNCYL